MMILHLIPEAGYHVDHPSDQRLVFSHRREALKTAIGITLPELVPSPPGRGDPPDLSDLSDRLLDHFTLLP